MLNDKMALQQIRNGQASPVYVCFGKESYRLEQFIHSLIDELVEPTARDLAMNRYDLNEQTIDQVLEDVETYPFMTTRKVVIASNAYFLTSARQGKKEGQAEHDLQRLQNYIQSPVDYSVLVIIVPSEKLDERRTIVKSLRQHAAVLPFQPLSSRELASWVSDQFQQLHCTIKPDAVHSLIINVGQQMQLLSVEIQKLALYVGAHGEVTTEIVDALVIRSLEQNIFKLIDHIVAKQAEAAFTLLNDLLLQREEPVTILLLIARQFRIIMQVSELAAQGKSPAQMASQLKLAPFIVSNAIQQSKHYNRNFLQRMMAYLGQLDYEMKAGKVDKVLALELLILKLA